MHFCGSFHIMAAELGSSNRNSVAAKPKLFTVEPLKKKLAQICV